MIWLIRLDVPEQTLGPMEVFSKLQLGTGWMDSDKVRDKARQGADEHDRAPAPMDFFCGH